MAELILRKANVDDLDTVKHLYQSVIGQSGCAWNENYPTAEDVAIDYNADCLYVFREGLLKGDAFAALFDIIHARL